ncbi:MAG: P1 family peptidase [Clostridiales bacterium]|jgi:L-aminopeptidase/D-esterase-like protein|nr:P1 family peptidase [Clostridiales bacterium]
MPGKFFVGHADDQVKGTGVTVIFAPEGATGGVSVRGAAPGTRETDLLKSGNTVEKINAVVLSGGSAFGLESCSGVMEYLREEGCGYKAGKYRVPIVCGAVLYDLEYKEFAYPDKNMGYLAAKNAVPLDVLIKSGRSEKCGADAEKGAENSECYNGKNSKKNTENLRYSNAGSAEKSEGDLKYYAAENVKNSERHNGAHFKENTGNSECNNAGQRGMSGSVGAGTGATIGKILGAISAVKSGIGIHTAAFGGIEVTAIVAVNAIGDVYGADGKIIAGASVGGKFVDTVRLMTEGAFGGELKGKNTTIGCIVTNAVLTKDETNKLADIAHDGYALAVRPVHTMFDGDTVFAMASGEKKGRFAQICAAAVEATAAAIRDAVSGAYSITESRGNLFKTAIGVWKQSKGKN